MLRRKKSIYNLAKKIIQIYEKNIQVGIVIGGGNILDINITGRWNKIKKYAQELSDSKDIPEIISSIIGNSYPIIYDIDSLSKKLSLHHTVLKKYLSVLS